MVPSRPLPTLHLAFFVRVARQRCATKIDRAAPFVVDYELIRCYRPYVTQAVSNGTARVESARFNSARAMH